VGGQGIFRHQLLGNLPRKDLIDTPLDVDFSKLIKLKLSILTLLLAFAHEIGLFGVGLRAYGHILAGGHRHGASHQSRDTRDQDIVLRRGRCGNADDQACRRDNPIVGAEDRCSQPPNAVDEVILRVQAKTAHVFLLITPPHCDLTLPLNCFQLPSIASQFMNHSCFLASQTLTRAEINASRAYRFQPPPLTTRCRQPWRRGRELTLLSLVRSKPTHE
jgi:hypothetical protein